MCPRRSRTAAGRRRAAPASRAGRGGRWEPSRRCRRRERRDPWRLVDLQLDQLELDLAVLHAGEPHRVRRRAPALGRAARVEDLKAVGARSCSGRCEWPNTTASARSPKRRRMRSRRPAAAPASCTSAMRASPAATTRSPGSRRRSSALSTLPCTAGQGRPDRLELADHLGGGEVAGVQQQVSGGDALDAGAGSRRAPRGMCVSAMTAISTHRMMVIVKDWGGLVLMPPLAVPPLSTARTVTVADPRASSAWREGERAVRLDLRLDREQAGVVVGHAERDRLAGLGRRPGRDAGRPAGDGLGADADQLELVAAGEEARRVVDLGDRDGERLRRARVDAAEGGAAVVDGADGHRGGAARVGRRV